MNRSPRIRPVLELLEDRLVPARILFSNGNLTLTGPIRGAIIVLQDPASGFFNVSEGGQALGSFAVSGNLTIDTTNSLVPGGNDQVAVLLAPGRALGGNLMIATGDGNDSVLVDSQAGAPAGFIGGLVSIDLGAGNDLLTLGTRNGLTVGGPVFVNGNLGNDTVVIGGDTPNTNGVQLRGAAVLSNVENLTVGTGNPVTVGGDLFVNDVTETIGTHILVNAMTEVGSILAINGGLANDTVVLRGQVDGPTAVSLGGGINSVTVTAGAFLAQDFVYAGIGSQGDSIVFGAATFGRNVTLYPGNGANNYGFGSPGAPFTVGGNMSVIAGDGSNNLGGFIGVIGGSLTVVMGNGPDALNFDGAQGATLGGPLIFQGGNGGDRLEVSTGGQILTLRVNFGTGDDTFQIDSAADQANLTGSLDWGDIFAGNDTFIQPAAGGFVLPWSFRDVE